ncbi:MAG: hypothetical protein ACU0E9_07770 [Limimaricola soesokkakensis]|uniref:hypothetical protein n=1 Tax=Limimaricola soesokkakensis TaxID=1343159 RepID=UPI0040584FBA
MGIAAQAPRGGLAEELAGASRVMILRNAEIERFEDQHRGVFDLWDGFFGRGAKPTSREARDLVALGLVGGGLADQAADKLIADLGPEHNLRIYKIAQTLLGLAFMPEAGDEPAPAAQGDAPKKKDGTCEG